jgi:hypothetical protein
VSREAVLNETIATLRARLATVEAALRDIDVLCIPGYPMIRKIVAAALAGDAPGETYTVGGADGITRTFTRDAPRCERCGGRGMESWHECPSCGGTGLAPPGTP